MTSFLVWSLTAWLFRGKGDPVQLTQWDSWFDCYAARAPWLSMRCLVWLYMGLVMGWAVSLPGQALASASRASLVGDDGKKTRTTK